LVRGRPAQTPDPNSARAVDKCLKRLYHSIVKYSPVNNSMANRGEGLDGSCASEDFAALRDLVRTFNVVSRHLEEHFVGSRLTGPQFGVLKCLFSGDPGGMSMSHIGEHLCVSRPAITGLIDKLHARGLLERVTAADRRQVLARLTPEGFALVESILPGLGERAARVLEPLRPDERKVLSDLLIRLRGHVRELDSTDDASWKRR